jgi:hypothetical protein
MWQLIAIVSGTLITLLVGVANVTFSMSLATGDTLGIPNSYLFAALGIALDLGLIACTFAYHKGDETQKALCAALFVICSLYSVHSLHGYLSLNTGKGKLQDSVQTSILSELKQREAQALLLKGRDLAANYQTITALRSQLTTAPALPIRGFEWIVAVCVWFYSSTCWYAFFGTKHLTELPKPTIKEPPHATPGITNGKVAEPKDNAGRRAQRNRLI